MRSATLPRLPPHTPTPRPGTSPGRSAGRSGTSAHAGTAHASTPARRSSRKKKAYRTTEPRRAARGSTVSARRAARGSTVSARRSTPSKGSWSSCRLRSRRTRRRRTSTLRVRGLPATTDAFTDASRDRTVGSAANGFWAAWSGMGPWSGGRIVPARNGVTPCGMSFQNLPT